MKADYILDELNEFLSTFVDIMVKFYVDHAFKILNKCYQSFEFNLWRLGINIKMINY